MILNKESIVLDLLIAFQNLPLAHVARAEIFMSDEQAARQMFPTLVMTAKTIELKPEHIEKIEKASGESVRDKALKVFMAKSGEMMVVDRVLGKHELITYAIGIDASGKVKQIEVLEYKETYGHEIKRAEWRKQFYGKDKAAQIKLKEDIQNISGATLSCKHLTDGVRRVLQTYEFIKT